MGEADDLTNAPVLALNLITKLVIDLLFCVLMGTII